MSNSLSQLADAIGRLSANELHQVAVLLNDDLRSARWIAESDLEATATALEQLPALLLRTEGALPDCFCRDEGMDSASLAQG
jgi:hypothetical protein